MQRWRKVFSKGGGVRANQLARAPELAGSPLGAENPLERMKGPEAPSVNKELPKGPPDSTEEDHELPGLP